MTTEKMLPPALLVRVYRGSLVESAHRGHAAVVTSQGKLAAYLGDPGQMIYARSSAKPLQAIPVVESGAADRFGLTPSEVALICASHGGEERHVAGVRSMLSKIGHGEVCLQCGPHEPLHADSARSLRAAGQPPLRVHNNCSGKHAGMLALAAHLGVSSEGYLQPEHPVQRRMLETIAGMTGLGAADIPLGVDGCGVPVYALPLMRLACAYARLAGGGSLPPERAEACRRIVAALAGHPFELAGTDRFDTALIEATSGRVIGKMGAEGVYGAVDTASGDGMAVKIEDGSKRALHPTVVELMRQCGWITAEERGKLARFHAPSVTNWRGDEVGRIEAEFVLHH